MIAMTTSSSISVKEADRTALAFRLRQSFVGHVAGTGFIEDAKRLAVVAKRVLDLRQFQIGPFRPLSIGIVVDDSAVQPVRVGC